MGRIAVLRVAPPLEGVTFPGGNRVGNDVGVSRDIRIEGAPDLIGRCAGAAVGVIFQNKIVADGSVNFPGSGIGGVPGDGIGNGGIPAGEDVARAGRGIAVLTVRGRSTGRQTGMDIVGKDCPIYAVGVGDGKRFDGGGVTLNIENERIGVTEAPCVAVRRLRCHQINQFGFAGSRVAGKAVSGIGFIVRLNVFLRINTDQTDVYITLLLRRSGAVRIHYQVVLAVRVGSVCVDAVNGDLTQKRAEFVKFGRFGNRRLICAGHLNCGNLVRDFLLPLAVFVLQLQRHDRSRVG